jgi:hypothetical protein
MNETGTWPKEIRIHTANTWDGRPWLEKFFAEHAPETTHIDLADPWDIDAILNRTAPDWVRRFYEVQPR